MSWFRREQFSPIPPPERKLHIPDGIWHKCEHCDAVCRQHEFDENLRCCPHCQHHDTLSSLERIELLLDAGTFEEHDAGLSSVDPLGFKDRKTYRERIAATQAKSGLVDAVRAGIGNLNGRPVSIAVMDFEFVGGSMGSVVGEKITRAIERGLDRRLPVIVVSTSGGARMQEGVLSLMQMAKTSAALARLGQARLPFISILTDPTTAGVMASFASLGDVIMAEPDALIGFAGPRVIEQTINQVLPKGFQRSEFVLNHGFIDIVCHRRELKTRLSHVLDALLPAQHRTPEAIEAAAPFAAEDLAPSHDVAEVEMVPVMANGHSRNGHSRGPAKKPALAAKRR